MRREVNDRNQKADIGFNPLHVTVMDAFIPFGSLAINEDKLSVMVQATHYADVDLPTVVEAIHFLNKKRYLRQHRLCGGRTGYELAYLLTKEHPDAESC